jgi:signal transduction histidine kinase
MMMSIDLYAASPIILEKERTVSKIGQQLQILEDKQQNLDFDAVLKLTADVWQSGKSDIPTFGFTASRYWLHFTVKNGEAESMARLLEAEYSHYDKIDFYILKENEKPQHLSMGDLQPFKSRLLDYRNFLVPFSLNAGQQAEIFISVATSGPLFFPINIWNPYQFGIAKAEADHFAGYYYGIVIAMFGYNLFLYLTTRKRLYLHYVCYTAGFFFFQYSLHGFAFDFLWPNAPWWANNCVAFFQVFALFWVTLFTINFLEAQKNVPFFNKGLWGILAGSVVTILLSLFASYSIAIRVGTVLALIGAILCLSAGVTALLRGYRPANFYVLAFVTFLIGIMINALKQLGVIEQSFFSEYAIQMGSALEMVLLSIALGDKIRIEQRAAHLSIKNLNSQLKELNESLEERVVEKTRDIRSIMTHIPQGIFQIKLVDGSPVIDDEISHFISNIIDEPKLAGTNPMVTVFTKAGLSDNDKAMISSVLESSIMEDVLQFNVNAHVLPRDMTINQRLIEVEFSPMLDANDTVEKILVTMKDVTDIRQLQLKSIEQAQEFTKLGEVARFDAEKMFGFFTIGNDLFNSSINNFDFNSNNNALVFRNLHTIKGLARNFQFRALTDSVHEVEQTLKDIQHEQLDEMMFEKIKTRIMKSFDMFKEYERINNEVLGRKQSAEQVVVLRKDLQTIHQQIAHAVTRNDLQEIENKILFLFEARLTQVISDEISLMESVCRNLNKPKPIVEFVNDRFIIPSDKKPLMRKVFVHLLRNSIDHGIEAPHEREAKGKALQGTITIAVYETNNGVRINYRDDGRGLDLVTIRTQGIEKGFIKTKDELPALQIANLIFEAGFSTAKVVTEISGRGVGMDAVRQFLKDEKCSIELNLHGASDDLFVPFSFDIFVDFSVGAKTHAA